MTATELTDADITIVLDRARLKRGYRAMLAAIRRGVPFALCVEAVAWIGSEYTEAERRELSRMRRAAGRAALEAAAAFTPTRRRGRPGRWLSTVAANDVQEPVTTSTAKTRASAKAVGRSHGRSHGRAMVRVAVAAEASDLRAVEPRFSRYSRVAPPS